MNTLPDTRRTPSLFWEDFSAGQRREFGAMPVSRDAVIAFASQFDPQPFHLDDEAAAASLFGRLSASGWHTCAMAMRLMCDDYLLDAASLGSPGIDSLRWLKPVYPGDTLRMRMDVLEVRPMNSKPHVGLVRSRWELHNQDGATVLQMEGWGMFRRRDVAVPESASASASTSASASASISASVSVSVSAPASLPSPAPSPLPSP